MIDQLISEYNAAPAKFLESHPALELTLVRSRLTSSDPAVLLPLTFRIGDLPKLLFRNIRNEAFWDRLSPDDIRAILNYRPAEKQGTQFFLALLHLFLRSPPCLATDAASALSHFSEVLASDLDSTSLLSMSLMVLVLPGAISILELWAQDWKDPTCAAFLLGLLVAVATKNARVLRLLLAIYDPAAVPDPVLIRLCANLPVTMGEPLSMETVGERAFGLLEHAKVEEGETWILAYVFAESMRLCDKALAREECIRVARSALLQFMLKTDAVPTLELIDAYIHREQKAIPAAGDIHAHLHLSEQDLAPVLKSHAQNAVYYVLRYNTSYTKLKSHAAVAKSSPDPAPMFPQEFVDSLCDSETLGSILSNTKYSNMILPLAATCVVELPITLYVSHGPFQSRYESFEDSVSALKKFLAGEGTNNNKCQWWLDALRRYGYRWARASVLAMAGAVQYKDNGYSTSEYILHPLVCVGFLPEVYRNVEIVEMLCHIMDVLVVKYQRFSELVSLQCSTPPGNVASLSVAIRTKLILNLIEVAETFVRRGEYSHPSLRLVMSYIHQTFIASEEVVAALHLQTYSTAMIPVLLAEVPSMHICVKLVEEYYFRIQLSTDQLIFISYLACYLALQYPMESTLNMLTGLLARLVGTVGTTEQAVREHYAAWILLMYRAFPLMKEKLLRNVTRVKEAIAGLDSEVREKCRKPLSKLDAVSRFIQT